MLQFIAFTLISLGFSAPHPIKSLIAKTKFHNFTTADLSLRYDTGIWTKADESADQLLKLTSNQLKINLS